MIEPSPDMRRAAAAVRIASRTVDPRAPQPTPEPEQRTEPTWAIVLAAVLVAAGLFLLLVVAG